MEFPRGLAIVSESGQCAMTQSLLISCTSEVKIENEVSLMKIRDDAVCWHTPRHGRILTESALYNVVYAVRSCHGRTRLMLLMETQGKQKSMGLSQIRVESEEYGRQKEPLWQW